MHKLNLGNITFYYRCRGFLLRKAIKKYGKDFFKREILEICHASDKQYIDSREKFWINKLNSLVPNGYNMVENGRGGIPVGTKHSSKTIHKIKQTWDIKKQNGYDHGVHLRGVKKPKEFGDKVSKRMSGSGNSNFGKHTWNAGKHWSDDVKNKISIVHKESKRYVGEGNPKYKPIEEDIWKNILVELKEMSVKELSKKYSITAQRLFRHLYYEKKIDFESLPEYLKKKIIKYN